MENQGSIRARAARGVAWLVLAAPLLVVTASADADLIIDDFSDIEEPNQWPVVMNTVGSTLIAEAGLTGVVGGYRETTIFANALKEPGLDDVTVTVAAAQGKFDYASTVGAEGSVELFYNGEPGIGLELDLSGETQFEIEFLLFDHSGGEDLPATITLQDASRGAVSLTRTLTAPGPQTLAYQIDDFARGGVDLTNIDSITVFFDGALATDFRIEEIRTTIIVPLPAAFAALGMGLAATTRRRRRC